MYKMFDYRKRPIPETSTSLNNIKLMNFIISTCDLPCTPYINEKVLSLINRKININTFLLSIIYYKRLIDKSDPYWSWIGVLILSDGYLNDISYNNDAWNGILNTTKEKIVELKKRILIELDYSLLCKDIDYINIKKSFELFS
jgi:hypothetical protein